MPEGFHVYEAIAEVQALVQPQGTERATVAMKTGGSYSYSYIGEGTLMDLVRPLLAERGIATIVNGQITHASPDGKFTQVLVEITFASGKDGSAHVASMPGQAADMGDKALAKALTSATRYCLWKTFLVPSRDPDADEAGTSTSYEPAPPPAAPSADENLKLAALSKELEQTVRHLAARKGRSPEVAELLEKNRGAMGVHPDYLQKLITRLDANPDHPFAEGSETPSQPAAGSLLSTPPATQPVAGGGVSDAQKDQLAALLVELAEIAPEHDWPLVVETKIGEQFGKRLVAELTESEAQQMIELATATKLELRGAS
jgi:hypothetical protein